MTRAPSRRKPRAIAWPIPCPAPVTRQFLPASLSVMIDLSPGKKRRAAGDAQYLPADEAAPLAGEEGDGIGDVIGRRVPLERGAGRFHARIGGPGGEEASAHGWPRTDRIHANTRLAHFQRQAARVVDDRRLG